MTSCSLTTFSLSSRLSYAPAPLTFRRTLREVLLDIYSRTSCSWRSLSPNFPENWKNMLLNAFLLTYVLEFCYSFQWKITRSEPLSHSLSLSLSPTCCTLSLFPLDKIVGILVLQLRCALHYASLARIQDTVLLQCDLVLSYAVLNVPLSLTRIIIVVI